MLFLFIGLLALLQIFLTFRVISFRRSKKIPLGDGGNILLSKAIRAHSNFIEVVPISLILILILEYKTYNKLAVFLCFLLLFSRLIHAYGISQLREKYIMRTIGTVSTMLVMIISSAALIYEYFN